MTRFVTTLATIWRLAIPYFRSEDRWPGRLLLCAIISMELGVVGISVLINQWNARFYNALQDRNWDNFISELLFFCMLAAVYIVVRVYQLYLNQWLQIRWRRWMTQRYVGQWLDGANHYRMQMLGDAADNALFHPGGLVPSGAVIGDVRLQRRGVVALRAQSRGVVLVGGAGKTVVALLAETGAKLEKGAPILTLEVMKMEQTLRAPFAGVLKVIKCNVGDIVQEGVELAEIEPAAG